MFGMISSLLGTPICLRMGDQFPDPVVCTQTAEDAVLYLKSIGCDPGAFRIVQIDDSTKVELAVSLSCLAADLRFHLI